MAKDVMALSRKGLARRAILSGNGLDETHYLDSLDDITARGFTPAEGLLDAYHNEWNGDIDVLFKDCMY
jgi:glutamate--cysteine ligase